MAEHEQNVSFQRFLFQQQEMSLYRTDGNFSVEFPLQQHLPSASSSNSGPMQLFSGGVTFIPSASHISFPDITGFLPPPSLSDIQLQELQPVSAVLQENDSSVVASLVADVDSIAHPHPYSPTINVPSYPFSFPSSITTCSPSHSPGPAIAETSATLSHSSISVAVGDEDKAQGKGGRKTSAGRTKKRKPRSKEEPAVLTCEICGATFKRASNLKIHLQAHLGVRPFQCQVCQATFVQEKNLKRHMVCHRTDRNFVCCECGMSFVESGNLTRHMLTHNGDTNFVCHSCGAAFSKAQHLKEHLRQHQEGSAAKINTCPLCQEVFSGPFQMKKHIRRIHATGQGKGRTYVCPECDKAFAWWSIYQGHLLSHQGQLPFLCPVPDCGQSFADNVTLRDHKRLHARDRRGNVCDVCSAAFDRPSHLIRHKRSHTGERPNICSECGAGFVERNKLQRHMRIHSTGLNLGSKVKAAGSVTSRLGSPGEGAAALVCYICCAQFYYKRHLTRHIRLHHSSDINPASSKHRGKPDNKSVSKSNVKTRKAGKTNNKESLSSKVCVRRKFKNVSKNLHLDTSYSEESVSNNAVKKERKTNKKNKNGLSIELNKMNIRRENIKTEQNANNAPDDFGQIASDKKKSRETRNTAEVQKGSIRTRKTLHESGHKGTRKYKTTDLQTSKDRKTKRSKKDSAEKRDCFVVKSEDVDGVSFETTDPVKSGVEAPALEHPAFVRRFKETGKLSTTSSRSQQKTKDEMCGLCPTKDIKNETQNSHDCDFCDSVEAKLEKMESRVRDTESMEDLNAAIGHNSKSSTKEFVETDCSVQTNNKDSPFYSHSMVTRLTRSGLESRDLDRKQEAPAELPSVKKSDFPFTDSAEVSGYFGDALFDKSSNNDDSSSSCKETSLNKTSSLIYEECLHTPCTEIFDYEGKSNSDPFSTKFQEYNSAVRLEDLSVNSSGFIGLSRVDNLDPPSSKREMRTVQNSLNRIVETQSLLHCGQTDIDLQRMVPTAVSPVPASLDSQAKLFCVPVQWTPPVVTSEALAAVTSVTSNALPEGYLLYRCTQCSAAFNSSFSLKLHKRVHVAREEVCLQCGDTFSSSADLAQHREACISFPPKVAVQNKQPQSSKLHSCEICGAAFAQMNKLKLHRQFHSNSRRHLCNWCGASFSKSTDLCAHVRTHTRDRPYVCKVCGSSYTQSSTLNVHMRTHSGQKPHVCKVCSAAFPRHGRLKVHMRCHNGEKPCMCTVCGMSFKWSQTLLRHMQAAHTAAMHRCSVCGQTFQKERQFTSHMQVHEGLRPHQCPQCSLAFRKKVELWRHLRTHTRDFPFLCDECGSGFGSAAGLKVHRRCHTGERPWCCDRCGRAFRISSHLTRHQKSHTDDPVFVKKMCEAVTTV